MKRLVPLLLLLAGIMATSVARAGEIVLSAGSGPLDSVINPVKDAFEKESGIRLNVLFGSASLAFKQLCRGISEAAAVGTSFEGILALMQREQFEVDNPETFHHVVIGKAMVRTVVNSSNPVSRLSREQLKDIFTGRITNWREVGGDDLPIIVVLSTLNPATNGAFRTTILAGEPFMREVLELGHMDELRGAVEVNREAVAIGTSALLGGSVKQVETPEVSRPIILITRGAPLPKVQTFIDFILLGPGRALVKD